MPEDQASVLKYYSLIYIHLRNGNRSITFSHTKGKNRPAHDSVSALKWVEHPQRYLDCLETDRIFCGLLKATAMVHDMHDNQPLFLILPHRNFEKTGSMVKSHDGACSYVTAFSINCRITGTPYSP